ncbi:3-ketodihydrosphingosine reductase-like [Pollicipes pollicipes]|uniref:3-ketodihydrosphingosine reductase-like n=1 Tax=Pollicipes pollicipes TaxID=41117 RepID=UPI0018856E0F|nr:3-ketodihydrosphingosine reductase-like [Pollicipes pollicipes]
MPLETYRRLMDVNYFGVVNVLHAVVPAMKYALVGLGQTLAQELKPYGVGVTLCYPPDTDTAGFEEENRTKPEETRLICATAGLFSPDEVAAQLLRDMMRGNITSTVGSEGMLMTTVGLGMGPVSSAGQLAREVLLMPLFRLVVAFFHYSWDGIVRDCMNKRDESKKSE